MKYLVISFILFLLSACGNYNLLVNDNLLYEPAQLYFDFSVTDEKFMSCLVQHIEDSEITSRQELLQVNCSYAGISDLTGIRHFSRIESLSLKGNPLQSIEPIFELANLRNLDLSEMTLNCQDQSRLTALNLDRLLIDEECQ